MFRTVPNKNRLTVLVVADDRRILLLAQAVLDAQGNHVLVAKDAERAIRILRMKHVRVDAVAIRAGISRYEEIQDWCLKRGAAPRTFQGSVDSRGVRLLGLDSSDDWERGMGSAFAGAAG